MNAVKYIFFVIIHLTVTALIPKMELIKVNPYFQLCGAKVLWSTDEVPKGQFQIDIQDHERFN